MPVHKRKYRSGQVVWYYVFELPGSTRANRDRISKSGFSTKKEAEDAEAERRIEERKKRELVNSGAKVVAPLPKTLSMLLEEFFCAHVDEKLGRKTGERYHEQAAYLDPELLGMPIEKITSLHLTREWNRLLKSGGHHRRTKQPRPLSGTTVKNIAGVISSAFGRAIRWGLTCTNPVTNSERPRAKKHSGIALSPLEQALVFDPVSSLWYMGAFLEVAAALGLRRGEELALRWRDIVEGRATIARSLSQTKQGLVFKGTKTDRTRVVKVPESALQTLETHRKTQNEFRRQFGPDYRADLDLIFANPDGTPLKPDSVSAAISLIFRRLKLPKGTSLHTLRHTHASHLLSNGVSLQAVSARLGHASVWTTAQIYAHMIHGQDDQAAHAVGRFSA